MEESVAQIARNMRSIGIDLVPFIKKGRLVFYAARPTLTGLEQYLVTMHRLVSGERPDIVVVDPISNLMAAGLVSDVKLMLTRMLDFLKNMNTTALFTDLTAIDEVEDERTQIGVSSLMDTWLQVTNAEADGDHIRKIRIIKSRGMANSCLSYRFRLSDTGIHIEGVLKDKQNIFFRKEQQYPETVQ
jgi:circadian clock protein KaiC